MGKVKRLHADIYIPQSTRQVLLSKTLSSDITIGLESPQTAYSASYTQIIEGGTIGLNRIMSAVSGAGGGAAGALWGPGGARRAEFCGWFTRASLGSGQSSVHLKQCSHCS